MDQIMSIYSQFALTAPSGMLSAKAFTDTFQDLTTLTYGTEHIPEAWMNLTADKLESLVQQLSGDSEYINWRSFLLQAARPWPTPSQAQLLAALTHFQAMDQKATGSVTREQYERVELWFAAASTPPTPAEVSQPYPYDRLGNLKTAFFDIFADHSQEPALLDYVSMLMYFSISRDAYQGFLRALSVASGCHMPRLPGKEIEIRKVSRPTSQASLAVSVDLEGGQSGAVEAEGDEDIPDSALESRVPLDALDQVLHHGQSVSGDSHRFSVTADPEDAFSRERLAGIYQELVSDNLEPIPFTMLVEHPVFQDVVSMCATFKAVDLKSLLSSTLPENFDTQSFKIPE